MAVLNIPDQNESITGFEEIECYLSTRGIELEKWQASLPLEKEVDQETILAAYAHQLKPLMQRDGYSCADVISVYQDTPGLMAIRTKFLSEHTHSENEVRYFIEGAGLFWFNLGGDQPVFNVHCVAGDFISVPKNAPHWFDLGREAHVRAIRVFTDPSGWVAHYTESGIDKKYNPTYM